VADVAGDGHVPSSGRADCGLHRSRTGRGNVDSNSRRGSSGEILASSHRRYFVDARVGTGDGADDQRGGAGWRHRLANATLARAPGAVGVRPRSDSGGVGALGHRVDGHSRRSGAADVVDLDRVDGAGRRDCGAGLAQCPVVAASEWCPCWRCRCVCSAPRWL
jgi:hypothetical protein